jgi:hypothetical protein
VSRCKSRQVKEKKTGIICNYCKKPGDVKANCNKLRKKNQNQGKNNFRGLRDGVARTMKDVAFRLVNNSYNINNEIWIDNSGASSQ